MMDSVNVARVGATKNNNLTHPATELRVLRGSDSVTTGTSTLATPAKEVQAPMAQRLSARLHRWQAITRNTQLLQVIEHGAAAKLETPAQQFYKQSPAVKDRFKRALEVDLQEQLEQGIITEISRDQAKYCSAAHVLWNEEKQKMRMVVDLRTPNAWSPAQRTRYSTLATTVRRMVAPGDFMVTADVKSAFHHVRLQQPWNQYLAFNVLGRHFQCNVLPFGWNHSPALWNTVMQAAVQHLRSVHNLRVSVYVDDILLVSQSYQQACKDRDTMLEVLADLGITIAPNKGQLDPSQSVEYLGMNITTNGKQPVFSVIDRTRKSLKALAAQLHKRAVGHAKRKLPVKILAQFAGKAISLSIACRQARLRTRALYSVIATRKSWNGWIHMSQMALEDLLWWSNVESEEEWTQPLTPWQAKQQMVNILFTDASDNYWAGVLGKKETVTVENVAAPTQELIKVHSQGRPIARGDFGATEVNKHIGIKELAAVQRTLESFVDTVKNQHVLLFCDNSSVVAIVNSGVSKSTELAVAVRNLWTFCIKHRIHLHARYINTAVNPSDAPSRWTDVSDWQVRPAVFQQLTEQWGTCDIDLFATQATAQVPTFVSRHHHPAALQADAFTVDWTQFKRCWITPPVALIPRVVQYLQETPAVEAIVVTPYWPGSYWYSQLKELSAKRSLLPRVLESCLHPQAMVDPAVPLRTREIFRNLKWRLMAFWVQRRTQRR